MCVFNRSLGSALRSLSSLFHGNRFRVKDMYVHIYMYAHNVHVETMLSNLWKNF